MPRISVDREELDLVRDMLDWDLNWDDGQHRVVQGLAAKLEAVADQMEPKDWACEAVKKYVLKHSAVEWVSTHYVRIENCTTLGQILDLVWSEAIDRQDLTVLLDIIDDAMKERKPASRSKEDVFLDAVAWFEKHNGEVDETGARFPHDLYEAVSEHNLAGAIIAYFETGKPEDADAFGDAVGIFG